MLKAAVSGSFHRHMAAVYIAVAELRAAGVDVLSPSDPRVVDAAGDFLFVASDKLRSIRLVQDRHFAAIRAADFLWVVNPDGYTGPSTSAEIGAAYACGVPIYSDHVPLDTTLQRYVRKVPNIRAAIEHLGSLRQARRQTVSSLLLDPAGSTENAIRALERVRGVLEGRSIAGSGDENSRVLREIATIKESLGPEQWQ